MRHISIKWRMTLWFTVVMVTISALVLVFVMLMNRNSVTRPPEAQVVYMVQRNADDLEFDHGNWDFSDVDEFEDVTAPPAEGDGKEENITIE